MSIATVIIGKSGTGKSASLRNLDPSQCLLIQAVDKPLPFKSRGWVRRDPAAKNPFNVFRTDSAAEICKAIEKTSKKIVIVDDFQYVLANELMRRSDERGYDKFSDIARHGWDVFQAATSRPSDVRVYILSHSDEDEAGRVKLKTIGKMLDEKNRARRPGDDGPAHGSDGRPVFLPHSEQRQRFHEVADGHVQ